MYSCSYGLLRTGKGVPTSLCWDDNERLVVGSTDHSIFLFDLKSGQVIRRFRGHRGIVNSVDVLHAGPSKGLIVSGSDDGFVTVWSQHEKEHVHTVELGYPITAVSR